MRSDLRRQARNSNNYKTTTINSALNQQLESKSSLMVIETLKTKVAREEVGASPSPAPVRQHVEDPSH